MKVNAHYLVGIFLCCFWDTELYQFGEMLIFCERKLDSSARIQFDGTPSGELGFRLTNLGR